jgi:hypothetical protein
MSRKKMNKPQIEEYVPPYIPLKRGMLRDTRYVQSIMLRMSDAYVDMLDELCEVNQRSRREIVEILIAEASWDYTQDPDDRISPL